MRQRLFSPQRFLQRRHEVVTLSDTGYKFHREWILARSVCHYRLFSLTDIPIARQEEVLQLRIRQWAPFHNYGYYAVWRGSQVQVWIWDQAQQEKIREESSVKRAIILPETVLHPRPESDTITLVECLEGMEGQIWQAGILIGSRWWSQLPTLTEWIHFQRVHGLSVSHIVPDPLSQPLLPRPWGKPRTRLTHLSLYQESIWITGSALLFAVIATWQLVDVWKWQQALTQLQSQTAELSEAIEPILTARTQAVTDKQHVEQLFALTRYAPQLVLMKQVAEKLPQRDDIRLVEWSYQLGELQFAIEAKHYDPIFYIKKFQEEPTFKEVKAETGSGYRANQLVVSVKLAPVL